MEAAVLAFSLAFFFSFIGSIPPGTINLTVLQLGLEHKTSVAWRLALAAALIEYPYAFLAIKFEKLITASPVVVENFHLITAIVMIVLGVMNLFPIPALDGGRILFTLPEILFRRRIPQNWENAVNGIAMLILIGLMLFVNVMDFINPVQIPTP